MFHGDERQKTGTLPSVYPKTVCVMTGLILPGFFQENNREVHCALQTLATLGLT